MKKNLISIAKLSFLSLAMAMSFSSLNCGIKDKLKDLKNLGSIKKERDNLRKERDNLRNENRKLENNIKSLESDLSNTKTQHAELKKQHAETAAQLEKCLEPQRAKERIERQKKYAEQVRQANQKYLISSKERFINEKESVIRYGDYVEPPLAKAVNFVGAINLLDSKIELVDIQDQAIAEISGSEIMSRDATPNLFFRKKEAPHATVLAKFTSYGTLNLASFIDSRNRHFTFDNHSVYNYKKLPADANYNFIIVFHPKGATNIKEMLAGHSEAKNNPAFDMPFDIVHEKDFDIANYQNK